MYNFPKTSLLVISVEVSLLFSYQLLHALELYQYYDRKPTAFVIV